MQDKVATASCDKITHNKEHHHKPEHFFILWYDLYIFSLQVKITFFAPLFCFFATLITGRSSHYYHPHSDSARVLITHSVQASISPSQDWGGRGGLEKELCHLKTSFPVATWLTCRSISDLQLRCLLYHNCSLRDKQLSSGAKNPFIPSCKI